MAVDYQLSFRPRANEADIFAWRPDFLDSHQIKGYKKEIKKVPFAEKARILGKTETGIEGTYDPTIRSSKVKWLPKSEEFRGLYERIAQEIMIHNNQHFKFDLDCIREQIQYTEYHAEDKGQYDWHMDLGAGWASLRKLSVTINLSDPKDYDGGVLEFNLGGKTITQGSKAKGAITVFPSYLLHRVSPVTRGTRKSLVLWVGGNQFR
tara:strand:+ start:89 stop:709 length:621 start_codon:yes stop_codon:yes gene_type:complete